MKEQIDIEALLIRAYRDRRVDRLMQPAKTVRRGPQPPKSPSATVMEILSLGTLIDRTDAGARMIAFDAHAAAVPDDMIVLHDHVLALADWLIEDADGIEPAVWTKAEIVARGWRIEDGAHGLALVRPGEGERGGDRRTALANPYLAALVIEMGRAANRPGWTISRPKANRPSGADKVATACAHLERTLYAAWHAALGVLAAELRGKLIGHLVTGPAAPATPWLDDLPRVLESCSRMTRHRVKSLHLKSLKMNAKQVI